MNKLFLICIPKKLIISIKYTLEIYYDAKSICDFSFF